MTLIQNLRIGTKLAIASGLGIILAAAMIYAEVTGGAAVRVAKDGALRSLAISVASAEAQDAVRNMQIGVYCTMQVSANITDVQRGASETGSASSQVLSAAQTLSSDSNRLKAEVGRFLNSVRAA